MSDYLVIFERTGTGYSAYVPDLPGCITTGGSLEATRKSMEEAINGHLAVMREFGDPIPEAISIAERVPVLA